MAEEYVEEEVEVVDEHYDDVISEQGSAETMESREATPPPPPAPPVAGDRWPRRELCQPEAPPVCTIHSMPVCSYHF